MDLKQKLLVGLLLLIGLAGCSLASEPIPVGPIESGPGVGESAPVNVPITRPDAANGQVLFAARCASCHGAEGAGDGEFADQLTAQGAELPNLSDPLLADQRTPQEWYTTITLGTIMNGGLMPPWRDALSDQERWDVTYYLYSLSHSDTDLAHGEDVFAANCAECHDASTDDELSDIEWTAAMSPGQIQNLLVGSDPHEFDELGEADLFAVTRYARTLAYDAALGEAIAEPAPTTEPTGEAPPEGEPAPAESITVQGTVTTSAGETVPAGTEVKLTGVAIDATGAFTTFLENTTTTGEDGSYRFEGLPIHEAAGGAAYVVTTQHEGVEFNNASVIASEAVIDLPIVVREVTTDANVISVDSAHIVIRENPDALLVLQVVVINNNSDMVYVSEDVEVGGQRGSVRLQLPSGAQNIIFEDGALGGRFVEADGAIYDTMPIQPGARSHNLVVQYVLPYENGGEVDFPMPYGAGDVTVLLQGDGEIQSEQLNPAGIETISEEVYQRYIGASIPQGGALRLSVAPKGLAASLSGALVPALIGLSVLLVVIGGGYWIMQRRAVGEDLTAALAELNAGEEALIRQIAALDDQYDAGQIGRLEYEARRAELKARVAEHLQGNG